MKKSLRGVAVALFTMSIALAVAAQNNMGTPDKKEALEKLQKMSAELQLTPQQKEKVRPILLEEAPKLKALKSDTSLAPLQKGMKMREVANDTDAKLKPILTPVQYQKWEHMRVEERQQMMQKMEDK